MSSRASLRFGSRHAQTLRMAAIVCLLCWPTATRAGEESRREPAAVVVFPGGSEAAVARAVRMQLPSGPGRPRELEAGDSRFIDALRRADLALQVGLEQTDSALCNRGSPSFSALVKGAGESIDFLDLPQARARISAARLAFTCGPEPASRALLSRLLFLDGVLRTLEPGNGVDLFEAALNVNPQMPFPVEQSGQVRAAFSQAVARRKGQPLVAVRLADLDRGGEQAGLSLRIDGVTPSGPLTLPAGQHFLQWVDSRGRAIAGLGARLSPAANGKPVTWPPAGVGVESRRTMLSRLELAVVSGRLSADMLATLQRWLAEQGHRQLLLVAFDHRTRASYTLRIDQNGRVEPGRQAPVVSRPTLRPSVLATVGLGAVTLVSAGYYGMAYHRLATEQFEDVAEGAALRSRGYAAGAVALAGLVGTGVTAGLIIVHPAGERHWNRSETLIGLSLGPSMAAIQLGGQW